MNQTELNFIKKHISIELSDSELYDKSTYKESGYNSAQVPRALSKQISILCGIGGMMNEILKYFNIELSSEELEEMFDLKYKLTDSEIIILKKLYQKINNSDVLFPGVTTYVENINLENMILNILLERPRPSVRLPTGIGGMRNDKYWNFCTTLNSYTNNKLKIDKRFYSGMGIFKILCESSTKEMTKILKEKIVLENCLGEIFSKYKNVEKLEEKNISYLCHVFVPDNEEIMLAKRRIIRHSILEKFFKKEDFFNKLVSAYHAPTHMYALCLGIKDEPTLMKHFKHYQNLYTFNAVFHLPFIGWKGTNLTEKFFDRIKNECHAMKFSLGKERGIGLNIYEFDDGVSYKLVRYTNKKFSDIQESTFLTINDLMDLNSELEEYGFLKWALLEIRNSK